jgi:L-ascorbate metabolism protein UlaG (beta-lactamase superfamily)
MALLTNSCTRTNIPEVKIHYLGHSSFLINFDNRINILTDYGKPNAYKEWGWDDEIFGIDSLSPTLVTYSHKHADHFDPERLKGKHSITIMGIDSVWVNGVGYSTTDELNEPGIQRANGKIAFESLLITPIATSESDTSVKDNYSYLFQYQNLSILHLGDCQANIIGIDSARNQDNANWILPTNCDIVMLPIESTKQFIPQLEKFISFLKPKAIIPMHYWSRSYKEKFFHYLNNKNITSGTKYKIARANQPFIQCTSNQLSDSIVIHDIHPSEFVGFSVHTCSSTNRLE